MNNLIFPRFLAARPLAGVLTLLVLLAPSVPAQTNLPIRSLTLQECLALALTNNFDVQITRLSLPLARYDLGVAQAGYDPQFTMGGNHSSTTTGPAAPGPNVEMLRNSLNSGFSGLAPMGLKYQLDGQAGQTYGTGRDSADGAVGLSLTQPLLKNFLTDSTRYNIAVARNNLRGSELDLQARIIDILTAVEQAYYELVFARDNVKVQREGLRLAERLLQENKKRVEIGALARLDEKQSESQVAARQSDLSEALRTVASDENALKQLITATYRTWHEVRLEPADPLVVVPQRIDLQESWQLGLTRRPDLSQTRLKLETQGITVKYFKNQLLPELDLIGSYGHGASGYTTTGFSDVFDDFRTGNKPTWSVGATLSFPLGNKAARNTYQKGKVTAQQLLLTLKKQEDTALVEIDEAVNKVRTSLDRIESSRQARIYAEQALDAEQKKLDSGRSTSFVVLQLQRDVTAARSDEIRRRADYNQALAALYQAEGSTLEHKNIQIEVK